MINVNYYHLITNLIANCAHSCHYINIDASLAIVINNTVYMKYSSPAGGGGKGGGGGLEGEVYIQNATVLSFIIDN